jgi:uncharacterized membrane protein
MHQLNVDDIQHQQNERILIIHLKEVPEIKQNFHQLLNYVIMTKKHQIKIKSNQIVYQNHHMNGIMIEQNHEAGQDQDLVVDPVIG